MTQDLIGPKLHDFSDLINPSSYIREFKGYVVLEIDQNHSILEVEIPGATKDDVSLEVENNIVKVKYSEPDTRGKCLCGFANRNVDFKYILPKNGKITEAKLENGILSVYIEIEVPESQKPKKIEIL